jgi:hypothetical protein
MAGNLITGSPIGSVVSQDEIYVEGSPYLFIQQYEATPLNNPDADGYYWGMSGTTSYPAFKIGCVQDVSLTEGVTMNAIRCDTVGDKGMIQRRDYIEFNITILSLFDFATLRHMLNLTTPTVGTGVEKMGIGTINNNRFYMAYAPRVYDPDTGDYILFHLHRAQFVDAWTINMKGGEAWTVTGLKLRAYFDESKPTTQGFGTLVRADAGSIP